MEIDAVPRRTYYYVLDLHGFNGPAQVSVVHDWTPTWTRGLAWVIAPCEEKKLSIAPRKLEFRVRAFSVIFSVSARRVHDYTPASLGGRRSNIFFRQCKRYWASSGWPAWSLARFFDETSAEVDCGTTIAKAELAIRTVLFAPATEAGIAMNLTKRTSATFPEKLDFAAGDKICSHDGHLKVSRGEILLVNLVVQLVQLLACWRIRVCVMSMCVQRGTVTWAFFFFAWLPRMAEALQSKPQGKKELVERNSVDLALGVRGCRKGVQRSIEKWLQHSDEPLSLSLFSFPAILFLY